MRANVFNEDVLFLFFQDTEKCKNYLRDDGKVGIGCSNPQYKLEVDGTIRAKEVRVKIQGCDFVLDKAYALMPLNERKQKVLKEKHLPNIPNAEGEKEMNSGELIRGLWQNVEEHELYLYELYEKIQQLERENMILKQKIEEMKK
ncbi:MAG: hypothetical protein KatS3mg027_2458 [Bacteroidia bacterium]|nr:MAG: hypothetical protein KatS3mg027_2458 [Bacteroidia bacterium]